ncbi:MAG: PD-(D/E)XK nuclease family protein [Actinomycetota bacterium]
MVSVTTTGFGPAAVETLGRLLDERRGGDPLARATVVCPGPLAAVGVRRALGRRPGGVAGVWFTTADELVEHLAADAMAEARRRPATDLEILTAIRGELTANPGAFGAVASHRTTEERLLRLHHQVAGLDDEHLARLQAEGGGIAADAFRVLRAAGRRTDQVWDRGQVLAVARNELDRLPAGALGPILFHLPEPVRPFDGLVLRAMAPRSDCEIVVGLTGDPVIDRRHRERLAGWGVQIDVHTAPAVRQARRCDVADPEDEVRVALAEISGHAAAGVPLQRMAVLYAAADPYATLLHEQLAAAGLPWAGPGRRSLASSLVGRFLLRLIELADTGLERSAVMALVSSAPVVDPDGHEVASFEWDHLSRQAGVIDDDHWEPRLGALAHQLERPSVPEIGPEGLVTPPGATQARALLDFVTGLRHDLSVGRSVGSWTAWSAWAGEMIDERLAGDEEWPAAEQLARARIDALLDQLPDLDRFGAEVDFTTCAAVVATQLDRLTVPGPPFGTGLLVAPINAAAGLDFERVVVVGLAEGLYPRVVREDALLPDRLRAGTGGLLMGSDAVTDVDTRAVAAALAASRHSPLALSARGDLRSIRSRTWPRELNGLVEEHLTVESHHRVLADQGRPVSGRELGLRELINHVDRGEPVNSHDLAGRDPVLARNLQRVMARRRGDINRHVGLVDSEVLDGADRLLSATALEDYASCPRRYLLGRVLRLGDEERPERIDEITPLERGTLVHAVLEKFITAALDADSVPEPGESWPADARTRLFAILDDEVADAQRRGITGGRVATLILRRRLGIEMDLFLLTDNELRAARQSTPVEVELGFGIDDEPTEVELPDGRTIRLRGFVDRVDATSDGGVLVIDYKGGSGRAFAGLAADPLDGGRRLQLPLYAKVVAERLGRDGPRTALYWLTRNGDVRPVELEDELESDLNTTVAAALDGISGGLFPGVPGETVGWPRLTYANCRYCDFDRVCPTDRQREWDSVRGDTKLIPVSPLLREFDQ